MLTMPARTILISALLLSAAHAQPAPPAPSLLPDADQFSPLYAPLVPVPPNGCAWASRSFSDGAGFCVADRVMQICAAGKWVRENATEGCRGAMSNTR